VQTREARFAALERLVGKLVLENDFLKGASRDAPRPRSETMPVITGPVASRSQKDAG
jgi:transposase